MESVSVSPKTEDSPVVSQPSPSGASSSHEVDDVESTEQKYIPPATAEIMHKYLSGEIALDNYEYLLDDEETQDQQILDGLEDTKSQHLRPIKVPPHIKALTGEANLRFARGDHETAMKMCYEIIRQHSVTPEPYITLAQIFESSDPNKSLEYYMVGALCNSRNVDLWVRCAQFSIKMEKINQAIFCYTNALRINPKNIRLHLKRIQLLRLKGDNRNMLRSYIKMMLCLTPSCYSFLPEIALKVAREYFNMKEYKSAIGALNIPFTRCPKQVTPEMVNIMLELLILNENFTQVLDIFLEHCNIEMELSVTEDNTIEFISYKMPPNLSIDFLTKFIICVIKLKAFHLLDGLLEPLLLLDEEVEQVGDVFLDVIEALMTTSHFETALKLLVPLIKSNNYSLAAVWFKYGDCQRACGLLAEAIESYRTVIQMAPLHMEVRYNLAEVLTKIDKKVEAIAILNQDSNMQEININLLVLKIKLLKELDEFEQYIESVELLIWRHCEKLRHYEEIRAVMYLERTQEKLARLKRIREFRGESLDVKPTFITIGEPTVEEEYNLFIEACNCCVNRKKYTILQRLIFTALTSTRFKNKYDELGLLGFYASIYNKDSYHAYPIIREFVLHHSKNNLAWNLFNVLLQPADDIRHTRFVMRFLSSNTRNLHLRLLEANYCLTVGNIQIGLGYYLSKLRSNATPLTCILLGCVLLHIFGQKFTRSKEKVTKTAIALFIKYSTMRSKDACQEINYNLGRLYQHFGLVHLSVHYYNLVLEYKSPMIDKYPNLNLKREAAYNLHVMYKNSKNYAAAKNVLLKYIRI